jgi:hypothetical protein
MSEPADNPQLITVDNAKQLCTNYLTKRYYDFVKINFTDCALIKREDSTIYRLHGGIRTKSRSLMDQIALLRRTDTYQCVVDINAKTGKILNYEFR